jgi:Ni,Fe-hydrogenase III large subunit
MNLKSSAFRKIAHGQPLSLRDIPTESIEAFSQDLFEKVSANNRVAAFFAVPQQHEKLTHLYAILADDEQNILNVGRTEIKGTEFESLSVKCPQVHMFEREIAEQYGITPVGHPWLKPVRYHKSYAQHDAWNRPASEDILPGVTDFYRVEGEQVHEVAVGPVHAGIIEPGHFRFQCHGEEVYHLEIALGYQHRGIERAMLHGPHNRTIHFAEAAAGDSTIAHTTSYCQIIEALSTRQPSARAHALRGIALELERLANHVGDLGALANDIGFLPTASYCGRIRGDFLNMTALLCGSRFGRGLVRPGGIGFDVDEPLVRELLCRIAQGKKDCFVAINLLWETQSVMARFEKTGTITTKSAIDLGLVGPAARACGLSRDTRHNHASGIFQFTYIPVCTCTTGDVFARAYVRWLEIQQSLIFITEQLETLPKGAPRASCGALKPESLCISLNEGWRGEVCHCAITDKNSHFAHYKIIDPSFHNWSGLALALRNQQISDFPICNKSFNLSYCGHDL